MTRRSLDLLGLSGWTYEVTHRSRFVTVAGYHEDEPAALPLITASGASEEEAVLELRDAARDYDWSLRAGRTLYRQDEDASDA